MTRRSWYMVAAVAALGALIGITLLAAGGEDGGEVVLQQIQPVTISGSPLPAFTGTTNDPAVGTLAPRVEGRTFGGRPAVVQPGRPTLLVFLSHSSAASQAEADELVAWHHAEQTPDGLDVFGVITNTDATAANYPPSSWLVRAEWPWTPVVDDARSSTEAAFGFAETPAYVLIDASGTVRSRATGPLATPDLVALLASALGVSR